LCSFSGESDAFLGERERVRDACLGERERVRDAFLGERSRERERERVVGAW